MVDNDAYYLNDLDLMSNKSITTKIFSYAPVVPWADLILFKGYAINTTIFMWMTYIKGLKTSVNFKICGLGTTFCCLLCQNELESHNHIFFKCDFTWRLIKHLLHDGMYFLLAPTLGQVLNHANTFDHKISKRIYLLSRFLSTLSRRNEILEHLEILNLLFKFHHY